MLVSLPLNLLGHQRWPPSEARYPSLPCHTAPLYAALLGMVQANSTVPHVGPPCRTKLHAAPDNGLDHIYVTEAGTSSYCNSLRFKLQRPDQRRMVAKREPQAIQFRQAHK
ncbi:hypothetical protein EDB85DRAFT_1887067 [Lactarius pseudohatsudake]|nr:hypothetical protein EDB85DRAFT_1887067 [Lactarius pseudohatsudake]